MQKLEENEEEFYNDEFEEKPSKSNKSIISNFDTLKKYFDIVEVEEKDMYDLFICKNELKDKNFIQYEVWLCTKIRKGRKEKFAELVLKYIDKLINSNKADLMQLSLFNEEDKTNQTNQILLKDLSFWDCINEYYLFDFDDYFKDIPKNNEEMITFVKKCITLYLENPEIEYNFFKFDFEFENDYMTSEPISDREMLSRLYNKLRMYFGISTYVEDQYFFHNDGSIHKITRKGEIKERFSTYYYGARLELELYDDKSKIYDLYDKEFCTWLREKLNVQYREPLTDLEVIKESILSFSEHFFKEKEELYSYINSAKDAVDFRKNMITKLKNNKDRIGHMGGGGGPFDDCYSYSDGYDLNNLSLSISQLNEYREQLGREIIEHNDSFKCDHTYILNLKGNEVFENMYKYLSGKPTYIQTSLF